ncbi:MAG: MGMT family protein [Patescibacteria group bacterium]|nr:MGMT family protein [Patescibacteria group bacterium]
MKNIDVKKLQGTPFQKTVWGALLKIPKGKTVTYKELAKSIGKPSAIRAVANAVGKNPMAPFIPCHRVVRSDGTLGGYSAKGGIKAKRALLVKEGVRVQYNK